jgi:hypothetical protein
MVPSASVETVNAYMIGMYGDDPLNDEGIGPRREIHLPNAYIDGQDTSVGTVSLGNAGCSQSQADALTAFVAQQSGCDSRVYPIGSGEDYWAIALTEWNIKPVVPSAP